MPSRFIKTFILMLLLSNTAYAAGPNVQEGRWQTVVRVQVGGITLPAPFKTEKCITMGDLVPNSVDAGSRCTIEDIDTAGNDVTWTVNCEDVQGSLRGHGVITYAGDTLEGAMEMVARDTDGAVVSNSLYEMRGERKGDCD
ncbi:MAG: hypothetical protein FD165_200 [Gammaproteobacteria bacterium]|nr:MAG: hypothetical protein FD165_200 [Gammaproteobacteria bacterium]TND06778.1 MAG: hypothetical protein FD120_510 [Gammaproteobacteria bacterium]